MKNKLSLGVVLLFLLLSSILIFVFFLSKSVSRNKLLEGVVWADFLVKSPPAYAQSFEVVSDGNYYFDSYKIKIDNDGFAQVLAYTRGYFIDQQGKPRFIKVPLVVRLNDGLTIRYDSTADSRVDWSEENVAEKLDIERDGRDKLRIYKGAKLLISILKSKELYFQSIRPEYEWAYELYDILDRYFTANKEQINEFIDTGSGGKDFILPWDVFNVN